MAPDQLAKRLRRAQLGQSKGAVEEFLTRRVPVQFGGMNDPFSPWEKALGVSLSTLQVLRDFDYPFVISTKSVMPADPDYLRALQGANVYVRMSVTGAEPTKQTQMERGVPDVADRLRVVSALAAKDVAVSLRLQPLILDQEEGAAELIRAFSSEGIKHVTVEYLKLPVERGSRQYNELRRIDGKLSERYRSLGAKLVGREYVLPAAAKIKRLQALEKVAQECNVSFGYADNDLLHLNTFRSCCNAADRYLRDANFFSFNILNMIKDQMSSNQIKFRVCDEEWLPSESMFSHLNSRSRPSRKLQLSYRDSWIAYLQEKWNSTSERGGPASYWGIENTGIRDERGNIVYTYTDV